MRRSDAQVRGTLYAIMLPIRQAKWFMEPASDKPIDKEIADRIQTNLFREMTITWDDFLRQALGYLTFGYSVFEKVFMLYDDNKVLLKKLAPRLQATIYRWYNDKDDNFLGLQQFVQNSDSGPFEYIDIFREKLVLFVNDQEGNNYEGISVLRSSYKNWYIKDQLYKIDAIGHDRFASGVPVLTEPEAANEGDKDRVSTILSNLFSREKSYIHLPNGWTMDMFEKKGGNDAIIKSIQHHNDEIAKNILAQFINLGSSGVGSKALGESFEELFLQSLNALGDYVQDVMNRFVIKQLVDLNWKVTDYPRLKHSRIMLGQSKWLEGLSKVGLGNAITRDNDIEQLMRETLGLPLMSPETMAERDALRENLVNGVTDKKPDAENNAPDESNTNDNEKKPDGDDDELPDGEGLDKAAHVHSNVKKLSHIKRAREPTEIEMVICDFNEVERCLDEGVDKFTKQVLKIKRQQAEFLSKEVLVETADNITVPFVDKLADRLFTEQKRQMNKGRRHLREEIKRQKELGKAAKLQEPELLEGDDFEDKENVEQFLKDKSKADSQTISNKTLGIALFGLYNLSPDADTDAKKQKEIFDTIMDNGNRDIVGIADASINKAYSLGRESQASVFEASIEFAIYSSVLDGGTCARCSPKDGVAHALDDPRFSTPNPTCLGGDRCRCINIYKTKDLDIPMELRTPADWEKEDAALEAGRISNKTVVKDRRKEKE